MKITTLNPQIITRDPKSIIALLEAFGFERTHTKLNGGDVDFTSIRMKLMKDGSDTESFHVDVIESGVMESQSDLTTIRINVDDFDAAYELLTGKGFKEARKFGVSRTESSKFAYLIAPSGFIIVLSQHIKD